jgi:hypothetical protein
VKPGRLLKSDRDVAKAMLAYLSLFGSLDDAQSFQKAAHQTDVKHLPPCVRIVKDGGAATAIYWRWLAAQAEAWS